MEDSKETKPSKHSSTNTLMNSQSLWQHAQELAVSVPYWVPALKRRDCHKPLPPLSYPQLTTTCISNIRSLKQNLIEDVNPSSMSRNRWPI